MAAFQRSRLLAAALEEVSVSGCHDTSVAAITARARVSRKTFYDIFESRDDCLMAALAESIAQLASVLAPAFAGDGAWSERLRSALGVLLLFLESERDVGAFVLGHILGHAPSNPELRALVLERLRDAVEQGRAQASPRQVLAPLTAEGVVGGVLSVIHTRLQSGEQGLGTLLNPLMWMIVLPYLGPAAAARELRRKAPRPAAMPPAPARDRLAGLDMRMTYRTARVLAAIAEQPGASNIEIADQVDVTDQGQISKLLARLARLGLAQNTGAGQAMGATNAWQLTPKGSEVESAIGHRFALGVQLRSKLRDV
jgi:AcrR family transcriptional regulator